MKLEHYYSALSPLQKSIFADDCGTTKEYLEKFIFSEDRKYKRIPKPATITRMVIACEDNCSASEVMEYCYPNVFSVYKEATSVQDRIRMRVGCRGATEQITTRATDQCSVLSDDGITVMSGNPSTVDNQRDQSMTVDGVEYDL